MARLVLSPHPAAPSPGLNLEVEARRTGNLLSLEYRVGGPAVSSIRWPDPQLRIPTDGLWRTTCFEAFVGAGGAGYLEFNLSPGGAWAAYAFDACREGMRPLDIVAPFIVTRHAAEGFALTTDLTLPPEAIGPIGLSAVIEGLDGAISWWALAHPSDKPDFHHPDARLLDLP